MHQATKLLMAYLTLSFIIPYLLNLAFDTEPIFRLPLGSERAVFWFLVSILLSVSTVLIAKWVPTIGVKKKYPLKKIGRKFLLIYLIIGALIVFLTLNLNLAQWRYRAVGISDSPLIALISIFQYSLTFILFWILITDHALLLSRKPFHLILKLLILFNLIGGMNGLGSALFALFFLIILVFPKVALPIMFKLDNTNRKKSKYTKLKKFLALIFTVLIISALIQPLLLRGITAKSGIENDFEGHVLAHTSFNYLINRHSVHMAQALASLEDGADPNNLSIVKNAFLYRIDVLLGKPFGINKPEISSYSRKALLQFSNFDRINDRGGSSPGLLAAFFMSFPLVFAFPFLTIFLLLISNFINYLFFSQPKMKWTGAFVISYFFVNFYLSSPFDVLVPGPQMGIVIATIIMSTWRASEKYDNTALMGRSNKSQLA